MMTQGSSRRRPLRFLGLLAPVVLLLAVMTPRHAAEAHPLNVYLQASCITVAPAQIMVEIDLTPGVLVAPQVLPELDTDGNQQITNAEGRAYVDAVLRNVVLQVDGPQQALAVTKIDMPTYLNI